MLTSKCCYCHIYIELIEECYINCNALQPIRCVHWTRFAVHFMGCHHFLQEISFGTSVNLEFNHKFISIVVLCPVNRSLCALCIVVHCAMNIAFSGCFRWMYQIPYLSSTGNWILHHWFGTKFYYKVRFLSFAQSFRLEQMQMVPFIFMSLKINQINNILPSWQWQFSFIHWINCKILTESALPTQRWKFMWFRLKIFWITFHVIRLK